MNILFTASLGVMASALAGHLLEKNHTLYFHDTLTKKKINDHPGHIEIPLNLENGNPLHGIVHLDEGFPLSIKWSSPQTKKYLEQKVASTHYLSKFLAKSPHKPEVLIILSNLGIYGDMGDRQIDENSFVGDNPSSEIFRQLEIATHPAQKAGIRVVHLRTGIVLGSQVNETFRLFLPHHHFFSGVWGDGKQYLSWISLDDALQAIDFILNNTMINGPVNLTSTKPLMNREWTHIMTDTPVPKLHPTPSWITRALYDNIVSTILLKSCRALPNKLITAGFHFQHSTLGSSKQRYVMGHRDFG